MLPAYKMPASVQCQTAHGKSFASFGEIAQGRLSNGDDFLVTLPVDLWSTCTLTCEPVAGLSRIDTPFDKSKQVARQMLNRLGLQSGIRLGIRFDSNIPLGKGLGSSTADMLAVVRAFENLFGINLSQQAISQLFAPIEPHDGLHYDSSVAYNHRRGRLLHDFNYTPDFHIVAVDAGGELSTLAYNDNLRFTPALLQQYDALYRDLCAAFARRDAAAIACCAHRSAMLHVSRTNNPLITALLDKCLVMNAMGILATHSGTCGGILLPGNVSTKTLQAVEKTIAGFGHVFHTKTLVPAAR